jgi:hypothetical protein
MCTENHVGFGRIHGSQLRGSECRARHTYTLATALTPLLNTYTYTKHTWFSVLGAHV